MHADERYTLLVQLLDAFVAGRARTREHVAVIESEFSRHLDDDPRFVDLEYELAMYGADDRANATALVKECEWALKLLQPDRRQA